ncbi:hypothetical protein [Streptomyces indicus]|nr:hypothetical protein [Streptomyces indicus]
MIRLCDDLVRHHGGSAARAVLAAYVARPVLGWLKAPQPPSAHRALLSGTAQLTLLLGMMCADDGADALAQHYYLTAAGMAREAQDGATLAIGLRTLAAQAHELGHRTPAVRALARHAADLAAQHAPAAARCYTLALVAVVEAGHDPRAARRALSAGERHLDGAPDGDGPFGSYAAASFQYQRGQTFAALKETAQATAAFSAALRMRGPDELLARALTCARIAETLLRDGHLERSLSHWGQFLDLAQHLQSGRVRRQSGVMTALLRPYGAHAGAAELLRRARQ